MQPPFVYFFSSAQPYCTDFGSHRIRNVSFRDDDFIGRAEQVVDGGDAGIVFVDGRPDDVGGVLAARLQGLLHVEVVA